MSLKDRARSLLEALPTVAYSYRTLRGIWTLRLRKPRRTPHGFDLLGRADMASGGFEPEETKLLAELFGRAEVFIDVGANVGLYTLLAARRGLEVVAVEPLPENLAYLTRNLALNGFEGVEIFPVAVADKASVLPLYGGDTGASLVSGWAGASAAFQTAVAVSTLDVLVARRFAGRRVVIKIDVEGAEARTLRGAQLLLTQEPAPLWLVEISLSEHHPGGANRAFRETFKQFWRLGYQASTIEGGRRPVSASDVDRWVAQGRVEPPAINFLFEKA
jgi:FkbM family methyltransferase